MYVDQLFDEIARLPADQRDAAVANRCGAFPVIAREVRALLAAYDREEAPTILDLTEGTELGHFQLEELLGQGATASVWRAWDTRLESYTALKLLDPGGGLRGTQALEAVLHEARAASSIISDHVIRIKAAGQFERGPHYVEMELCAERQPTHDGTELLATGRSLAEVPLSHVEEKVRVVAEAARGVDAAHRVGVLHRDLKPGNILLTPVSRRAKVVDFGLAAEQLYPSPGPNVPSHRTVTVLLEASDGKVVGTPAYMPPEQAFGHPPTRATDVYALGATLYALLIDDHPYVPRETAPVPALDVLDQVRRGPPPPIGRIASVPRRLQRIIERAMARSARDRYATAGELARDLEAWRTGYATSVDGRAPLLRLGLMVRRHRGLVATGAVGMCVLLAFAGALGSLELERRILERRIAQARVELMVRQGMTQLADAARQRAQDAADEAEVAWRAAVRGESDAEKRFRMEQASRQDAEQRLVQEEAALGEAEAALAGAVAELETTRQTLEDRESALTALVGELEAELQRNRDYQVRIAELETARQASEAALSEAREEWQTAARAADRSRHEAEDALRRIEQLRIEIERLEAEVAFEVAVRQEAERDLELLRGPPVDPIAP